jgi:hypothetical protein
VGFAQTTLAKAVPAGMKSSTPFCWLIGNSHFLWLTRRDLLHRKRHYRAMSEISLGDHVRIHQTPETEALGVARRVGKVHGYTTPSVTGVVVIGDDDGDYAIAVFLEGSAEARWFAPRLLEFVDHAAGTEIRVGDRVAVRDSNGNWVERSADHSLESEAQKPRWKFW